MRILKPRLISMASVVAMSLAISAQAGPYTDDLSKCLVSSTMESDRTALVQWMFSAAASHPAVKSIASVSEEQVEAANKTVGELFTKLLTESCREQAEKALKYEGKSTIESSFQVLGQVAGRELFSSPEVAAVIAGLRKYLDAEKLKALGVGK
jgi:hypothetical protein